MNCICALLLEEILASRISVFFALVVMVSAVVVVVFAGAEGQRVKLRFPWRLLPALLLVGVSLALPLLLNLGKSALDESRPQALVSGAK